jgi:hypothetical protein
MTGFLVIMALNFAPSKLCFGHSMLINVTEHITHLVYYGDRIKVGKSFTNNASE